MMMTTTESNDDVKNLISFMVIDDEFSLIILIQCTCQFILLLFLYMCNSMPLSNVHVFKDFNLSYIYYLIM